jgi:hypothetical protein
MISRGVTLQRVVAPARICWPRSCTKQLQATTGKRTDDAPLSKSCMRQASFCVACACDQPAKLTVFFFVRRLVSDTLALQRTSLACHHSCVHWCTLASVDGTVHSFLRKKIAPQPATCSSISAYSDLYNLRFRVHADLWLSAFAYSVAGC